MSNITYNIADKVTGMLRGIEGVIKSGAMEQAMGRGATARIKEHFFALNSSRPNALGGRRTNFWTACARSTNYQAQPGEFTVSINQVGFRQRLEGGTIRPTGGRKFLTIPAIPEAHGKRASEFSNLRFGYTENRFGNLAPALVEASASTVKFGRQRKDGTRGVKTGVTGGKAVFWLARKVFQKADPSVLPSEGEILGAAIRAGELAVQAAATKGAR